MEAKTSSPLKTGATKKAKLECDLSKCAESNISEELKGKSEKPKANIDLFLSVFETWNNQNVLMKSESSELANKVEIAERKNTDANRRISDLESTVNLLENSIDSIHNDLDLMDKINLENQELKKKLAENKLQYETLKMGNEEKFKTLENQIQTVRDQYDKEIKELKEKTKNQLDEKDSEMQEKLIEKDNEIEKVKKEKQSEISLLTINFEEKISKLQRQKVAVTINKQQQSSNTQEIFRRKLQHLKSDYEAKMNNLKSQVCSLQNQLRHEMNQESTQNRMTVSSNNQPVNKGMRRF